MSMPEPTRPQRDFAAAMQRGLMGRCPNCGKGRLFRKFLKVADTCPVCGEDLHHHRADDAPAYFVILLVGHIVVPLALFVETEWAPPYWVHWMLWMPLTLALDIGLLPPIKGAIVGWQWAHEMHGFDQRSRAHDDPEDPFGVHRAPARSEGGEPRQ